MRGFYQESGPDRHHGRSRGIHGFGASVGIPVRKYHHSLRYQ